MSFAVAKTWCGRWQNLNSNHEAPSHLKSQQPNTGAERNYFGLHRNVFVLGWVSFFNDLSGEIVAPLIPFFITEALGAGTVFLGLVEGLADFMASILQLFSGWLSDRVRRRKELAVGGYSVSGLARGLLALVTAPWQALVAWFFNQVGRGIRSAPRDALLADSTTAANRGRSFGYQQAMDNFGAMAGALIAALLLFTVTKSYRVIFALAFLPVALVILLMATGVDEAHLGQTSEQGDVALRLSLKPFDKRFKVFLLAILIFTLGNSSDVFILLAARQNGSFSLASVSLLWALLHVVRALANFRGGVISDRVGRKRVIMLGWLIYVIAYTGFALARFSAWFWVLLFLYGFYYISEATAQALVTDLVEARLRGIAFGIYNFTVSIALLPASLLMGLLWAKAGPRYAFLFGAGMALIAMIILSFIPLVSRASEPCDAKAD